VLSFPLTPNAKATKDAIKSGPAIALLFVKNMTIAARKHSKDPYKRFL
jgi:hypothetical protein